MVGEAVSLRSVKQTLIATSTMQSKFVSCFEATSQVYGLRVSFMGLEL